MHAGYPRRRIPLYQCRLRGHRRGPPLPELAKSGVRPEEIITDLKAHPSIAPYLRGADVKEYAAHLIPEGGYDTMPKLATDGMLIAGDAAAMTLAAGIWLEGVNFAIGSGYAAGRAADRAIAAGDLSEWACPRTGRISSSNSYWPTTSACDEPPPSCSPIGSSINTRR